MKRFSALAVLYFFSSITNAQTCPPINQILVERNDRYELVLPPEWVLISDQRSPSAHNLDFLIAAWGDHKHPSDSVRCFYQDPGRGSNIIRIETKALISESKIISHPQWDSIMELYHMCNSHTHNVNECPFG